MFTKRLLLWVFLISSFAIGLTVVSKELTKEQQSQAHGVVYVAGLRG